MEINSPIKYPKPYIYLVCFLWAGMLLQDVARAIFIHLPGCSVLGEYFVPAVIIILLFFSLPTIVKQIRFWDVLFYLVIAALYLMNYTWHPENVIILDQYKSIFLYDALLYYFVGAVLDFESLKRPMYYVSLTTLYVSFFWFFLFNISGGIDFDNGGGGMSTAYALLPHLIFVVWNLLEKSNVLDTIAVILGSITLLSMGNRGSIVAFMIFVILFLLVFKQYKKYKIGNKILTVAVFGILYCFLDSIILILGLAVATLGGNMRVIEKFSNTIDLIDDSGRADIRENIIDSIEISYGYGFAGDQGLVGTYSHNLFIEWAISFGIIIAGILIIALIFLSVKAYKKSATHDQKMFIVILLCCSFKLMVSGTYLSDALFFFMIGFFVRQVRNKGESCYNNTIED